MSEMRNSRRNNHLSFEMLEHRRVLAGNVNVLINDSVFLVVGDAADNQVQISQDSAGRFVVTGIDNTTINRSAGPVTINGGASHVTISMANGNDEVSVSGMNVRSNFSFYGGFGDDRLEIDGLTARHFHGEGSPGNDVFELNFSIRKSAYLYLGAGNDVVSGDNLSAGRNFKVFGHGGDDTFESDNLNVGRKMEFHLDAGNDSVLFSGNTSVGRFARFNLGQGNDFVGVMPTSNGGRADFGSFVAIDAREGSNSVAFDRGVDVDGRLRTEAGDGPNFISLGGADFASTETAGFGNLQDGIRTNLIDQVFATLESVGIGVPDVEVPLEATVSTTPLSFTEDAAPVSIDSAFTLTGTDTVTGAEIQISDFVAGQEVLTFTNTNISGVFDATTGIMSLAGNASAASYQESIRQVFYQNTSNTPLTDARQFNIVITSSDETVNISRDFSVTAVNDTPVVTADNANQTVLPENLPVFVDDLLTVSDADNDNLQSATVNFASAFVAGEDVLSATDSSGITSTYNSATGVLTLTGDASAADWQTVLRTVSYSNTATTPTDGTRGIRISISDGESDGFTDFQINVQAAVQPNEFDVSESAANGTVVGQITTTGTFLEPTVYQFENNAIPADLLLNADDHMSGDAAASVVLIEYLDFQCPACAAFHPDINQLENDFDGDLLVVRRHLPIESIHPNAREAAIFSEAAARQGMFEEMADQLFTNQSDWANVTDPTSIFEGYASAIGLNMSQLQTDLVDAALDTRVTRDLNEAIGLSLTSTPTFLLQNIRIQNPASLDAFSQLVRDEVNALDNAFTINRQTGEIILRDTSMISSTNSPVELSILVEDTNGNSEVVTVTINVTQ